MQLNIWKSKQSLVIDVFVYKATNYYIKLLLIHKSYILKYISYENLSQVHLNQRGYV